MSRLPVIKVDAFNPEQRAMFDAITTGKRATSAGPGAFISEEGGMRGPFHPLVYVPKMGNVVQRLGECIRYEGALSDRQREIAILVSAARWRADYEWVAHARIARECGVPEAIIDALRQRRQPVFDDATEAVVYDVARSALDHGSVPDLLYRRAVESLGNERVVEIVILVGYYTLISLTLNVFEIAPPAGEASPFA